MDVLNETSEKQEQENIFFLKMLGKELYENAEMME